MVNTHFLYLYGHLRLIEEQNILNSLNKLKITLIGLRKQNQLNEQAIAHCHYHSELASIYHTDTRHQFNHIKSDNNLDIVHMIKNSNTDVIMLNDGYSDYAIKAILQQAIKYKKHVLFTTVPNCSTEEINQLSALAEYHDVYLYYGDSYSKSDDFIDLKSKLNRNVNSKSGILRISSQIQLNHDLILNEHSLRSHLADKIGCLISLLADFSVQNISIHFSNQYLNSQKNDVLIINISSPTGMMITLETIFTTTLPQSIRIESINNNQISRIENYPAIYDEKNASKNMINITKQLDEFVLGIKDREQRVNICWLNRANEITNLIMINLKEHFYC